MFISNVYLGDKLEFDLDELRNMRDELRKKKDRFEDARKKLPKELSGLKKDWDTPAGRTFFREMDDDWSKQVKQYIRIVEAVLELLDGAIREYEPLQESADSLSV